MVISLAISSLASSRQADNNFYLLRLVFHHQGQIAYLPILQRRSPVCKSMQSISTSRLRPLVPMENFRRLFECSVRKLSPIRTHSLEEPHPNTSIAWIRCTLTIAVSHTSTIMSPIAHIQSRRWDSRGMQHSI